MRVNGNSNEYRLIGQVSGDKVVWFAGVTREKGDINAQVKLAEKWNAPAREDVLTLQDFVQHFGLKEPGNTEVLPSATAPQRGGQVNSIA